MNNIVEQIYIINMKKDVERLKKIKGQVDDLFKYILVKGVDPINDIKYKNKYKKWVADNNIYITNYENFDWKYYVNRYHDLKKITTKEEAWKHWINFGDKELRSCNKFNDIVNAGQWGCLYSHINIIKNSIKNDYDSIMILEDDIILTQDIQTKIENLNNFIKEHEDWNIIYLGASQHVWSDILFGPDYYYANNTTGTFAVIINKRIFKDLLDCLTKMLKPVDNYLVDIQKKYYGTIYVLYPNIIICNLEESNIGMKRNNNDYFKKFRWIL